MKKTKQTTTQSEVIRGKWARRIIAEKGYDGQTAEWMARRIEALLDHLQYGHAVIAYYKQDGTFRFVTATLIYYEEDFHNKYNPAGIRSVVPYWDVEQQGWRTFLLENFLEWKPFI